MAAACTRGSYYRGNQSMRLIKISSPNQLPTHSARAAALARAKGSGQSKNFCLTEVTKLEIMERPKRDIEINYE